MEIVTYANKSFGLFEQLVNNSHGVPVRVLGWGTKWNGFKDKFIGMVEYLKDKNDDDIIVFLDGFDSEINHPLCNLLERFQQTNCKVLMSKEPHLGYSFLKGISKSVYGDCRSNLTANTGMYMGYAKYLRIVLQDSLQSSCSDDQVVLNKMCKKYPFIRVDKHEVIFKNIPQNKTKQPNEQAIFVSYPGSPSMARYTRAIKEYTQFFYFKLMLVMLVLMYLFPKLTRKLVYTMFTFTMYFLFVADKSCLG